MNILIIDDDSLVFELIKNQLLRHWPEAIIDYYDPVARGIPDSSFNWSKYRIILLDYEFGSSAFTGLDILKILSELDNYPIVILITAKGDEKTAVSAIQLGADDYLIKNDILTDRFKNIIEESLLLTESPADSAPKNVEQDFYGAVSIPGYQYLQKISSNKSQVILAKPELVDRHVAIKIHKYRNSDKEMIERFEQEVDILKRINHKNIIRILDSGQTDNIYFYVMPYYPEGDMRKKLFDGALPPELAKNYIAQILDAVNTLHLKGIIHRDLKSNNIFIGDNSEAVVADLNSAITIENAKHLSGEVKVIGTPFYMSPEQINGQEIDTRTDIYSLGILFYEMLSGKKPFTGNNVMEIIFKHTYIDPEPLPETVCQYQPVISTMLSKNRNDRYENINQIIKELKNV